MTAYTSVIKAGKYEDDMIPKLAIHAFRHAFERACASSEVLYVKNQQAYAPYAKRSGNRSKRFVASLCSSGPFS